MNPQGIQTVERVVVVPRSGYINRLQAMASAALLAQHYEAEFKVCWEPQSIAPAAAEVIFNTSFVDQHLLSTYSFREQFGYECSDVPRYLNCDAHVISLAGYEYGEQFFMPDLQGLIANLKHPLEVVISAGGNFSLSDPDMACEQRGNWYRNFIFSRAVEQAVKEIIHVNGRYIGLHLRYTDRAHETPLTREIDAAIRKQVDLTGVTSVFVSSDTPAQRDKWLKKLSESGLKPWAAQLSSHDRANELAGVGAMVDWKVLGSAVSSVYFEASSFGREAAVMAGSTATSTALAGHPFHKWKSRGSSVASAVLHYPKNHWGR